MKFLRSVKGCPILDKIRNDCIRRELGVMLTLNKMENYRWKWKDHLEKMASDKAAFNYNSKGTRDRGRPRKRWNEAGTGL